LKHPKTKRRCTGTHFKLHQAPCRKPVRDLRHAQVTIQRYRCLKCQRTFRVYPAGVSADQLTASLKALWVLLYLLGLSYQGVVDLWEALLHPVGKTTVYHQVQAAGKHVRQLRKQWRKQHAGRINVLGIDFTPVRCAGQDQIVAVATALLTGAPIDVELLEAEARVRILKCPSIRTPNAGPGADLGIREIREIADEIGAEILVTDDADALKTVADELDCQQRLIGRPMDRLAAPRSIAICTIWWRNSARKPWSIPIKCLGSCPA
jgi:transposase-like protein